MVLLSKQIWICVKHQTTIFNDTVFLYSLTKTGRATLVNETAREWIAGSSVHGLSGLGELPGHITEKVRNKSEE